MHCINPITEVLTENCLKLQNNAYIDFSYDLEYLLSVGESGKGSLLSTKLEDISPKTSYVKSTRPKLGTRKSLGFNSISTNANNNNNDKIDKTISSVAAGGIGGNKGSVAGAGTGGGSHEFDFDLCFDVVKEWTLHKIVSSLYIIVFIMVFIYSNRKITKPSLRVNSQNTRSTS